MKYFEFEKIEKNAFFGLDQLTYLHIFQYPSGKKTLPLRLETNSFNGLSNLKEINFFGGNVSIISENFFDIFPKLSYQNRKDNRQKFVGV